MYLFRKICVKWFGEYPRNHHGISFADTIVPIRPIPVNYIVV